jgi:hypothetical protein
MVLIYEKGKESGRRAYVQTIYEWTLKVVEINSDDLKCGAVVVTE